VRHVFDAEGRPVRPGIVQPAAEAQPHAPIDLLELGVDPSAVLTG
jgi:hypothetical protein